VELTKDHDTGSPVRAFVRQSWTRGSLDQGRTRRCSTPLSDARFPELPQ
jgi:hypothetical protein